MKEDITTDSMYIKMIIKKYDGQRYANKFDNFDEVDQFLERHNLPKFTQGKIDYLTKPISIKEIESIINNLPKQKAAGPDGFTGEFYQEFKAEIISIFYNLFSKIEAGILSISFYETNITLIAKPEKITETYNLLKLTQDETKT